MPLINGVIEDLRRGLLKSFVWVIFNGLIGILPLLVIFLLISISSDSQSKVNLEEKLFGMFADCAVMFLCSGLTGAVMLDFALSKIKPTNNIISFGLFGAGFLVITLVTVLFVNVINHHAEVSVGVNSKVNFHLYAVIQNNVILFTLLYSLTIKTYLYAKEDTST